MGQEGCIYGIWGGICRRTPPRLFPAEAAGVDTSARDYAIAHGLRLTEFRPDYARYGHSAPLRRNRQIVEYADLVLLFWDGSSHGTRHVLELCRTLSKPHHLFTPGDPQN